MTFLEKKAVANYNKIARGFYDWRKNKSFLYKYIEMPATLSLLEDIKGKKLLDLGCGPGVLAKLLQSEGASVSGIDISAKMIEMARANAHGIDFKVGSGYRLPYPPESFDIVLAAYSMEYFEDLNKVLREIKRVLKKNGRFVFSIPTPIQETTDHIEGRPHTWRKFEGYFDTGFRNSKWNTVKMHYMHRTYENWIKTIVRNGFIIEDYVDAKPITAGRKANRIEYEYGMNVPRVCVFKVRKAQP
jgi:ubiquinone/menaquinone biosynthesis C-methylase UbiE